MRVIVLIGFAFFVALVAACGVDGEPEKPGAERDAPKVTVSGSARVGVIF
ncbi:hypothetical protein [Pseudooceanicola onchidii]|nr:hypothetical protein [Pseudooceanicola onchidii]